MKIVMTNAEYRKRIMAERRASLENSWVLFRSGQRMTWGPSIIEKYLDGTPAYTWVPERISWRERILGLYTSLKSFLVALFTLTTKEKYVRPAGQVKFIDKVWNPKQSGGIDIKYHFRDYFDTKSFKRQLDHLNDPKDYPKAGPHRVGELYGRKDDMPPCGKAGVNPFAPKNSPVTAREQ